MCDLLFDLPYQAVCGRVWRVFGQKRLKRVKMVAVDNTEKSAKGLNERQK